MNERERQHEEMLRLERQQAARHIFEGLQTEERFRAEDRQRQEQQHNESDRRREERQRQEDQHRQDDNRRDDERRRQLQRRQEEHNKQENSKNAETKKEKQKEQAKTPQSQELRDLANIHDMYSRLAKSGYYDEMRSAAREANEPSKQESSKNMSKYQKQLQEKSKASPAVEQFRGRSEEINSKGYPHEAASIPGNKSAKESPAMAKYKEHSESLRDNAQGHVESQNHDKTVIRSR